MRLAALASKVRPFYVAGVVLATVGILRPTADPAEAAAPGSEIAHWLRAHVFTGSGGCLAVQEGQSLEPGDTVHVFEAGKPARAARIAYLVSSEQAEKVYQDHRFEGVYANSALQDSFGCYWGMKSDPPRWIAHCDDVPSRGFGLPMAITGLPPTALTIGGARSALTEKEFDQVSPDLQSSVPLGFEGANVLRAGWRYASPSAGEIFEILLGRPFGTQAPYDSIQICALFLRGGHVLAVDRFSRETGVEERVDTEPPTLTEKNWFEVQEQTIGYVSLDHGATWKRMTLDVGFEGYLWTIRTLADGLPEDWEYYLYTAH